MAKSTVSMAIFNGYVELLKPAPAGPFLTVPFKLLRWRRSHLQWWTRMFCFGQGDNQQEEIENIWLVAISVRKQSFLATNVTMVYGWYIYSQCWLVVTGTMEFWMTFQKQLGMSSSQLTFTPSFFRGVGQPPTRHDLDGFLAVYIYITGWGPQDS